ncbi:MAG: nucleotidyl transferase family protein [uncultured bacterium]|nr:MAG: nucleotidyl transferase family protein [uncultured bacterium]OGT25372.1 MAG: mannose-1-phosphate guanylyltransferase [Gammaproteobacteria bacterium RIFCSPHIGHO2_02_FULL_42_43]OGT51323.1 MAG: mannose-1-phosphate guanylyltransferase [Gammaproteobacteria bacterium RIFCSPHIGHO2_12_FULL_41_25]OGT62025.1 MAG: mannose-1-phosphate guanylyltransferase [Gammaproteobacteria bacterium RIFCSPLOWO2_02_FULL_42_14]OGT85698.1 MAG: mannose-1-phosphate guanylyltransferase [Gammaproteobacteria bacterium RI
MKAMLLAAGRGERLRPLTDHTPKPLISIGNTTLIEHIFSQLRDAGIQEVVINVHHLAQKMMQYCGDGSRFGLHIHYSVEKILLDTGGGILQALPLLGRESFLVMSADIWTDFPLQTLLQRRVRGAHLVLVNNPDFHPNGDFGLMNDLLTLRGKRFTYANIAVLHPDIFVEETRTIFPLADIFTRTIQQKIATGQHYSGSWHNIGTLDELNRMQGVS